MLCLCRCVRRGDGACAAWQGKKKAPGSKPCFIFNGGSEWEASPVLSTLKNLLLGASSSCH